MRGIIFIFLLVWSAAAQTTNIQATTLKDQSGALVTGSICFGPALFVPTTCRPVTNGVVDAFTVPNGTYAAWLNNNDRTIHTLTGKTLSGTKIDADSFLLDQFAANVGGTYIFFPPVSAIINGATVLLPQSIGLTCNGNAVTVPSAPLNNQMLRLVNLSTTTPCSISGNGNSVIYQGAVLASPSLPAKNSADVIFVQNYDQAGAGRNAWIVVHLGT